MAPTYKLILPAERAERLQYIRRLFPQATGTFLSDDWPGGRAEALKRLHALDAPAYARNRNFINGAVSRLSPYLRHGCLTLSEAAQFARAQFGESAEKFVFELAWRDYWRRVWYQHGDDIFGDIEVPKVAIGNKPLPDFIRQGITGLPCMDGVIRDLMQTGYVHNHARMWFAAYLLHWLKVDWREAADWFENQLLDGDKASNHLSWQWIASTFSSKPYFFNKTSLARYTGEKYCAHCKIECPFDHSMEMLQVKLFSDAPPTSAKKHRAIMPLVEAMSPHKALMVFVHDEMLSPKHALMQHSVPKIFIFDPVLHGRWPLKRLQFVADCLAELQGVEIWLGDVRDILNTREVGRLITQQTPNHTLKNILRPYQLDWRPEVPFIDLPISENRLKRFSRYWDKVGPALFGEGVKLRF